MPLSTSKKMLRSLCLAAGLILALNGCTISGGTTNFGIPVVTNRTAISNFTLSDGSLSRLTLNIFSNNTLTGSVLFDDAGTKALVTILLTGTYDSGGNYTAGGTGMVNGTSTTITITGKLPPDSGVGGSVNLKVNAKTFTGSFTSLNTQNVFNIAFTEISGTTNANTSSTTFSNVTTLLSATNPGKRLDAEAKTTSSNNSRVLHVILNLGDPNALASGAVFPIFYTGQSGTYTITAVYGEEGTFATGFARVWVARGGTLIIDSVQNDGTITYRLINARMTPFTEINGNPATGSFTVNYTGRTNINNGNTGGGGTGGGGNGGGGNGGGGTGGGGTGGIQSAFTGQVLLSNFNLNNSQKGNLNLNVQGDGGITGTLRFDSDATRVVTTVSLVGATKSGTSGDFTANGTLNVDGTDVPVALTGTIPSSGTGGNFTAKFGTKSFTGTFTAPTTVPTLEQALFSNVSGVNGTTSNITFDDFNTVLDLQSGTGEKFIADARPILNSKSRALSFYLNTAQKGKIVPGGVYPITYNSGSSTLITQVIYGENGDSSSGFERMWVARSGTLVIDSINSGVVTARLINCQMSPLSEVNGNKATGTFTLDFLGRTTPPR